ncbi:unnamed protein product [Orchesella dallaii]|uniref:Uncharacterized protein n=1 Tax=Orchesella dallaii TaxID=48710 RepID=A0ABP1S3S1_9HEXA
MSNFKQSDVAQTVLWANLCAHKLDWMEYPIMVSILDDDVRIFFLKLSQNYVPILVFILIAAKQGKRKSPNYLPNHCTVNSEFRTTQFTHQLCFAVSTSVQLHLRADRVEIARCEAAEDDGSITSTCFR